MTEENEKIVDTEVIDETKDETIEIEIHCALSTTKVDRQMRINNVDKLIIEMNQEINRFFSILHHIITISNVHMDDMEQDDYASEMNNAIDISTSFMLNLGISIADYVIGNNKSRYETAVIMVNDCISLIYAINEAIEKHNAEAAEK
jgi:hypothetical protein